MNLYISEMARANRALSSRFQHRLRQAGFVDIAELQPITNDRFGSKGLADRINGSDVYCLYLTTIRLCGANTADEGIKLPVEMIVPAMGVWVALEGTLSRLPEAFRKQIYVVCAGRRRMDAPCRELDLRFYLSDFLKAASPQVWSREMKERGTSS